MTPTKNPVQAPAAVGARRNEKVGQVVSTKMQKTIVVAVEMRKAHAKYKRIVRSTKKFYAHDEQSSARMGDVVRIRETRPLSKLKRWSLEEIVPCFQATPFPLRSKAAERRANHGCANENDARGSR
jgi:small subunit ribosomal protein S17